MSQFTWFTAGESHGEALVMMMEGMPAGFPIDMNQINTHLRRRQGGHGRGDRQKIERDPQDPELVVTVRGVGYRLSEGEG